MTKGNMKFIAILAGVFVAAFVAMFAIMFLTFGVMNG